MILNKIKTGFSKLTLYLTLTILAVITMDVDDGTIISFTVIYIIYYIIFKMFRKTIFKFIKRR